MPGYGADVSTAGALASQSDAQQQAGTYINFGAGSIAAPTDFTQTPSTSQTPTAALGSAAGGSVGGAQVGTDSTSKILLWVGVGTGVLSLVAVVILAITSRSRA